MLQLIEEIEGIIELSDHEREQLIDVIRTFVIKHFHPDPEILDKSFHVPHRCFLNQQEDEDNVHSFLRHFH